MKQGIGKVADSAKEGLPIRTDITGTIVKLKLTTGIKNLLNCFWGSNRI